MGRNPSRGPAAKDEVAAPTGCGDCRYSLVALPVGRRGTEADRAIRPMCSGD
ncbi:hypothetical protein AGMMS50218_04520 [Actinomycetota bacterium]|nr:hypothetical protein AGMMS50218_04520 [Actinomycetota bacterium]